MTDLFGQTIDTPRETLKGEARSLFGASEHARCMRCDATELKARMYARDDGHFTCKRCQKAIDKNKAETQTGGLFD